MIEQQAGEQLRVLHIPSDIEDAAATRRHFAAHAPHIRLEEAPSAAPFDAVLLVQRCLDSRTLELLERLRGADPVALPTVLVTDEGDGELAAQALRLGVDQYLVKHSGYLFVLPSLVEAACARARLTREQAALRDSEERFRVLFEQAGVGVAQLDTATGRFVRVNEKYCDILGYSSAEMLDLDFMRVTYPDDLAEDLANMERLVAGEITQFSMEKRLTQKDGHFIWVDLTVSRMWRDGEPPRHHIAVVTDISARKLTGAALEMLSTGMAHLSGDAFLNEAAGGAARLLGLEFGFVGRLLPTREPRVRLVGLVIDGKVAAPFEYDLAGTPCEVVVGRAACRFDRDVQHAFPNDLVLAELGVAAYAAVPLFDRKGRPLGQVGVMSRTPFRHSEQVLAVLQVFAARTGAEIEREEFEAQLRQSQKMQAVGTLAGGIAHDFNNVLTIIITNLEFVRTQIPAEHPAAEGLDDIWLASERARSLIRQIVAFSRNQEEPQQLHSLRPIAAEATKMLRSVVPVDVLLSVELSEDTPAVMADATQVHQVLLNLCTNAWHALGGRRGHVAVRLERVTLDASAASATPPLLPGEYACLSVSDDGSGMDAATVERAFEPFFTTKAVGQGTGLGLSVVHAIMEAHHGAIAVESRPGEGTTFRLYFPAARERPQLAQEMAPAGPLRGPAGLRVLYLDDEPMIVKVAMLMLDELGHRATGFSDADEALTAIRQDPTAYDVVVSDLNMPTRSGLEVAAAITSLRADLPVVIVTGLLSEAAEARVLAAGARRVLAKPFTLADLAAAVHAL